MSEWDNYYKDWGNPTKEDMEKLKKLVKKFVAKVEELQKEKEERGRYPLFFLKEGIV